MYACVYYNLLFMTSWRCRTNV